MKTPLNEAQEVLLDVECRLATLSNAAGCDGLASEAKIMVEKARALIAQSAEPVMVVVVDDSSSSGLPPRPRLWFLGSTARVKAAVVIQDEKAGSSLHVMTAEPVVGKRELFEVVCDLLASEIQNGTVPLVSVQQILH
jgi:hypothetical protein